MYITYFPFLYSLKLYIIVQYQNLLNQLIFNSNINNLDSNWIQWFVGFKGNRTVSRYIDTDKVYGDGIHFILILNN